MELNSIYEIDYHDERLLAEIVDHYNGQLVIKLGKPLTPRLYDVLSTLAFKVRNPVYIGRAKKLFGVTYGIRRHSS